MITGGRRKSLTNVLVVKRIGIVHFRTHLKTIIAASAWAVLPLGACAATKEPLASDAELPASVSKRIAALQPKPVHVYLTSPDGKVIDSMHVAEAAQTEKLLATLKRSINPHFPALRSGHRLF